MLCYIPYVMLYNIKYVFYTTCVRLYSICRVMLYNIKYVML